MAKGITTQVDTVHSSRKCGLHWLVLEQMFLSGLFARAFYQISWSDCTEHKAFDRYIKPRNCYYCGEDIS